MGGKLEYHKEGLGCLDSLCKENTFILLSDHK